MGRKIPGRKHRGVKDPEKQRAERFAKVKDKINAPPSNPDDQQISKSLSRIIDLKNKVKNGVFNKRKKNRNGNNEPEKTPIKRFIGRPEKQIPKFERLPGESDREFKRRMNKICSDIVREVAFEDKFNVDIRRNEKGEVEGVDKRGKDELEVLVKKLRKESKTNKNYKGKKKQKPKEETQRLTKSQKWSLKQAEKKKKKLFQKEEDYSFGPQREQVQFGEIVHAPPTLVPPKKVGKLEGASRPGQKQLLLKSMLTNEKSYSPTKLTSDKPDIRAAPRTIDKKAKRKSLPHALRRQLDKQQKEIIESYKIIKSRKYSTLQHDVGQ